MKFDWKSFYVYDIETFKYVFTLAVVRADGEHKRVYECSKYRNDMQKIIEVLEYFSNKELYMVGFNNLGFDYPIIHEILENKKKFLRMQDDQIPIEIWKLAQKQIDSFKGGAFGNTVKTQDRNAPQIDLYKIHHFDNKAKTTSLKMLEFNMKMKNIEDLPFGIEDEMTEAMIAKVKMYNQHDVEATRQFLHKSEAQVKFRLDLSEKYGRDFNNHNDGKIGKDYFQMRLEEAGIALYDFDKFGKRKLRQTKREKIHLKDCLFSYYNFERPEFKAIQDWFSKQSISETKGVFTDIDEYLLGDVAKYANMRAKRNKFFSEPSPEVVARFKLEHPAGWIEEEELKATYTVKNADGTKTKFNKKSYWKYWRVADTLNVVIDGFQFDFGVGGIHGSLSDTIVHSDDEYEIIDADVGSMYPNIAISNKVYPAHLGVEFCDIYADVYEQRKSYPKTAPENAMLKLALNSVYGDSNNKYSVFYDPQYTMTITINGQLSLCLLAEQLMKIPRMQLIQVNTDGITVKIPREHRGLYDEICKKWEKQVGLQLEFADYKTMFIADVNNYMALYTNGKVKRKGRYQYEGLGWHQDQSALVIPKAVEAFMLHGKSIEEFVIGHNDDYDFILRTKVPRSSSLILKFEDREEKQQNICRYFVSKSGGKLIKRMPPLAGKEEAGDREIGINTEWNVTPCNDLDKFDRLEVNYDFYISEAKKLIIGVGNNLVDQSESEED